MCLCLLIAENISLRIYPKGGKLLKNFFDYKDEKITEKAFSQSVLISVICIVLCLVALCSMTYAWFANETASNVNTLTSGSFDVKISVVQVFEGSAPSADVMVTPDADSKGQYVCTLEPGKYTVSLELTKDSTVKGHCLVIIGNDAAKHTAAIMHDEANNADLLEFTLVVSQTVEVVFEPRWGAVVTPDIENGDEIVIGAPTADPEDTGDQ